MPPTTQAKPSRQISVGPSRATKTLAEAVLKASVGDTLLLDGGPRGIYSVPKTQAITKPMTIQASTLPGKPPVISYSGGDHSSALSVSYGVTLILKGVDFLVNSGAYAVNVSGGLASTKVTVRGGGGAVKSGGSSHVIACDRWSVPDLAKHYIWYVSALTTRDDATAFEQRPGAGFVLTNSTAAKGTTIEHVVRCHNVANVHIADCDLTQTIASNAVLRIHDGGDVALERNRFRGDVNVSPMGEENGGKNLPPGPKRNFYDAMRLRSLTATACDFRTGDFKINAGLLNGHVKGCTISDSKGGSVIDAPFPYMGRPRSKVLFEDVLFSHADGTGRVFSSDDGARDMKVIGKSVFNGKPFAKP